MKAKNQWQQHWLLEAVRLKESQWGPIEDAVEVRRVIAAGGSFAERLCMRAQLLAQRAGWVELQQSMVRALRLSLIALSVLFVFIGTGVAIGALATQDGRVNVLIALVALLGIPTVSLLLWGMSFFIVNGSAPTPRSGFGVSHIWLWLSQRLVKGSDQSLLLNALFSFSSRQHLLRWVFSGVNHWLWILALLSATGTILVLLAAKRYSFNWETTLLSADSFVTLVQSLGVLPSFFGFLTPTEAIIRQSDGLQLLPASAQVQWSSWLVGCLIVYGVLPRLLALMLSLVMLRLRQRYLIVNSQQLGLIELRQRLIPFSESVGVDAEAGVDQLPETEILPARPAKNVSTVVIGIELSPDQPFWPPFTNHAALPLWQDAGLVDSREQRAELLTLLMQGNFEHVILCVDAQQTPDRGVIAWLVELASYGKYCTIYLMNTPQQQQKLKKTELVESWLSRLAKAGFTSVYTDFEHLLIELD